ncbi:hypothetical protein KAF44_26400 (plasmid) [Cupriavidus necator]|nr:hypothetical protein KAF44_24055 [Cupriavidus necator]UIF88793.1 hypothetical protein KAF44_26400 [Cupriavidus necator]
MIEDELQQTKPDPPALQMTPVSQAYAQSRVEIFDQRAAAWCAAQRRGYGGVDVVKRATDAAKERVRNNFPKWTWRAQSDAGKM